MGPNKDGSRGDVGKKTPEWPGAAICGTGPSRCGSVMQLSECSAWKEPWATLLWPGAERNLVDIVVHTVVRNVVRNMVRIVVRILAHSLARNPVLGLEAQGRAAWRQAEGGAHGVHEGARGSRPISDHEQARARLIGRAGGGRFCAVASGKFSQSTRGIFECPIGSATVATVATVGTVVLVSTVATVAPVAPLAKWTSSAVAETRLWSSG